MHKYLLYIAFITVLMLTSCAVDVPEVKPLPEDVFTVSDIYLMKKDGGKYLILFNSNLNRAFTYASISILNIEGKDGIEFIDNIFVDSLGGKFVVSPDEKKIFAATREDNKLYSIDINSDYTLSYSGKSEENSVIETFDEPYAVETSDDGKYLFVSHIRNGEIAVVDTETMKIVESFKMDAGISDIEFMPSIGAVVVAHTEEVYLSILKINNWERDNFSAEKGKIYINIPQKGSELRGLSLGQDENVIYISSRNQEYSSSALNPIMARLKIHDVDGYLYSETEWYTEIEGSVGEIATAPNGSGGELVFVASNSRDSLFVIDADQKAVVTEISLEDENCAPYQIHYSESGEYGRLFVSCFSGDKIVVINGENLEVEEVEID